MTRRRLGWLAAASMAGSLLLAGCADDSDGDGDGDSRRAAASVEFRRVLTSSQLRGGCRASTEACRAWSDFDCPERPQRLSGDLLMTCGAEDHADQPYLLAAAEIVGGVTEAEAVNRAGAAQWEVEVRLDPDATEAFADLTADLVPDSAQLAIVLDDEVVSAPAVQLQVTDGRVRLAGDYTQAEAEALADRLAP